MIFLVLLCIIQIVLGNHDTTVNPQVVSLIYQGLNPDFFDQSNWIEDPNTGLDCLTVVDTGAPFFDDCWGSPRYPPYFAKYDAVW